MQRPKLRTSREYNDEESHKNGKIKQIRARNRKLNKYTDRTRAASGCMVVVVVVVGSFIAPYKQNSVRFSAVRCRLFEAIRQPTQPASQECVYACASVRKVRRRR